DPRHGHVLSVRAHQAPSDGAARDHAGLIVARRTARKNGRGAVPQDGTRIRNEVAALALLAFAVLSLVALFADPNAIVLSWWRRFLFSLLGWGAVVVPFVLGFFAAEMWFGLLRRSMAAPIGGGLIAYTALLSLAQHYQRGDPAAQDGAGGYLGSALAKIAAGALGDIGAPIADLVRPAWEQRRQMAAFRPGVSLPSGTAPRFARDGAQALDAGTGEDGPAEPMRINMPPERPKPLKAVEAPQRPPLRPATPA